jgi:hypothetical protein
VISRHDGTCPRMLTTPSHSKRARPSLSPGTPSGPADDQPRQQAAYLFVTLPDWHSHDPPLEGVRSQRHRSVPHRARSPLW